MGDGAPLAVVAVAWPSVLLSSVPLFMAVDKNFINNDDQSEFEINLRAPEGTSLESTEVITNRVATAIRAQRARGGVHARADRRRPGQDAQPRQHLRAAEADRGAAAAISSR